MFSSVCLYSVPEKVYIICSIYIRMYMYIYVRTHTYVICICNPPSSENVLVSLPGIPDIAFSKAARSFPLSFAERAIPASYTLV